MLDCRKEPIPQAQSDALAAFMLRPEFLLLLKIIESRADELIVEASKKAIAAGQHPNYLALAEAELKDAQSYQACIAVLNEVKSNPTPYIIKVTA